MANKPNVFLIGAAKCGTTSLYRVFEESAGIEVSSKGELHHFSAQELVRSANGPGDQLIEKNVIFDREEYLSSFDEAQARIIVDSSPSYFRNANAVKRIFEFDPKAKIILCLRNPADKVFSQWLHLTDEGRENQPFDIAYALSETRQKLGWSAMYDYRAGGLYAPHLKVWLEHFHENVFVILFEDLVENPKTVLSLLFEFLEADCDIPKLPHLNQGGRGRVRWKVIIFLRGAIQGFLPKKFRRSLLTHISNVISWRKLKKKPSISTETRQSILAHCEEDIRELEKILGRKLIWS